MECRLCLLEIPGQDITKFFIQRYIHFINNDKKLKKGNENYDPLFKVFNVLDKLMKMLVKAWKARQ